ncbi:hypothetical protein AWB81_07047 [Caballeronia arationis]|uniref:hypothetical protein n=1 Tax=Caballeronia arationis TaxID=1777142 RepID=UPI00074CF9DA|nr:hypothetical protein [Caballeronia arationis]SAL05169.1 hypothetical protein AWB81_07047 [Caballeronia arationis]
MDMDEPSEVISVRREEGGWVWSISSPDLTEHRMKLLRQSARAFGTYEEARRDAEFTLEQLRDGQ